MQDNHFNLDLNLATIEGSSENKEGQLWIEDDKGNFIPLTKDLFYYYDPKLKRIVVQNNMGVGHGRG